MDRRKSALITGRGHVAFAVRILINAAQQRSRTGARRQPGWPLGQPSADWGDFRDRARGRHAPDYDQPSRRLSRRRWHGASVSTHRRRALRPVDHRSPRRASIRRGRGPDCLGRRAQQRQPHSHAVAAPQIERLAVEGGDCQPARQRTHVRHRPRSGSRPRRPELPDEQRSLRLPVYGSSGGSSARWLW